MSPLRSIFLLSLIIGLSYSLPTEASSENTDIPLNCTFSEKLLRCEYRTEIVECDAVSSILNLTVLPIQVFGLSAINNTDVSDVELIRIALFPRLLDLHLYFQNSIVVNSEIVNMSLYYSLSDSDIGIRVTDKACFSRMLNLVKNVKELHKVIVQQNLVGDGQEVKLLGLLSVRTPNSRFVRQFFGSGYRKSWGSSQSSSFGGFGGYGSSYSSSWGSRSGYSYGFGK